jgi:hypothetical protein
MATPGVAPGGVPLYPGRRRVGKWGRAFSFIVFGLVLVCAGVDTYPAKIISGRPGPRTVTADDLAKLERSASIAAPWVVYTAPKVVETGLRIVDARPGRKKGTQTRFLLVPVKDRWLLTEVAADFTGVHLDGRVEVWLTPRYHDLMQEVRRQFPDKADRLLPYQLNAETPYPKDARMNSLLGGSLMGFGMLLFLYGLGVAWARPPAG